MRATELAPGEVFAGYHVLSQLGEGGMGIVYLAEHIGLGRKVALKLLPPQLASDPRFRERFIRESRLAASLDHPNVIPIYEAGESEGRLFLAMRYVEGTDLNRVLHDEGRLEPGRAIRILKQVGSALDAAHDRGLVHRDVKPGNVLLARTVGSEEEHAYLSDFGLTKRMASESGITDTGQFVGSLDYAAPEQFEGRPLTPATDLYSLGCVLYECLAGEPPFRREQDAAVMYAHLLSPPPKVTDARPELLPGIDEVMARAMAKKPDERYASGAQLVTAAVDALGLRGEEYRVPTSPLRRLIGARRSRRRKKVTLGAVAVALVIALVAVVLPAVVLKSGNKASAFPSGVDLLEPKSGHLIANIPRSVIREADAAYYFDGHFWVANEAPNSYVEIDPKTGRVLAQVAAPDNAGAFVVDANTLWVATSHPPRIVKLALGIGFGATEEARYPLPNRDADVVGMALLGQSLWVVRGDASEVDAVSTVDGHLLKRLTNLPGTWGVAAGDGAVWTDAFGALNRIDPETYVVTKTKADGLFQGVAAGGGYAWVADDTKGVVQKVDPSGTVVAAYATGEGARWVWFDDGLAWVANTDEGTYTSIDAVTGDLKSYRVGHPVGFVAAGSGVVLVEAGQGRSVEDRIDALKGNVVKLLVPGYQDDEVDPAVAQTTLLLHIESSTCANLLNHPGKAAPDGWQLRPEVASGMPQSSTDGRTYTFTVRSGYRFSPPSNQPVTAETFRYTIERTLSPKLGSNTPGPSVVGDIEGEQAFREGKAEHISGIQVRGDTLTITLVKPSADFLERLSLPFFCPVPVGATVLSGGVVVHPPGELFQGAIPSAGPYYVSDWVSQDFFILRRNPNYHGPRPHALDAIVLREGLDSGVAVRRVESEGWQGISDFVERSGSVGPFEPEGALASRWGPGSPAAAKGDQRYYPLPDGGVLFLEFNANRPLFSDARVRQAASLALDRGLLGRILIQAVPAGDLLAPNLTGAPAQASEASVGRNLDRARSLMGGRTGKALISINPPDNCPSCAQVAGAVKSELAEIGIDVRIKVVPADTNSYDYAHRPDSPVDIRFAGFGPDAYLLVSLGRYLSTFADAFSDWWPRDVRKAAQGLSTLAGSDLQAGTRALVSLLDRETVLAPVAHTILPAYLSPSLGCRVFPPFGYGIDLAAMCLQS
jgi:serine/threonine protein kinase/ABC-type transport system substrate-binding protein